MEREPDPATARVRALHQISDIGFRQAMEDRHVLEIRPRVGLFGGVFDGHGGTEAAEILAVSLHQLFFEALGTGLSPPQAIRQAYRSAEESLQGVESGATAATVFLRGDALSFAHVGDSEILLVGAGPIALTRPHRVDDPGERSRIVAAGGAIEGGYVVRGVRGLMPTRSFGDSFFRPVGVMAVPVVGERRLGAADRFLVVACDGLFDVLGGEEIARTLLQSSGAHAGGESLREAVLARGGTDNLTILVIELDAGLPHRRRTGGSSRARERP
ncbi:MAG: PP2C family serine/threonine-protein phosphatase [Candidatus Methylomirabilales bacterium]